MGYNSHIFDIRYLKNLKSAQSIKVKFKFPANIPAGSYGYALVITIILISISSDGQRFFHLI